MGRGDFLPHFSVLNQLAHIGNERTPAQLAKSFHVTRGAMTNTLSKLEMAGYIHIRPDWDDARRKLVALSPAGSEAGAAAGSCRAGLARGAAGGSADAGGGSGWAATARSGEPGEGKAGEEGSELAPDFTRR